jgi:hypothetical protein
MDPLSMAFFCGSLDGNMDAVESAVPSAPLEKPVVEKPLSEMKYGIVLRKEFMRRIKVEEERSGFVSERISFFLPDAMKKYFEPHGNGALRYQFYDPLIRAWLLNHIQQEIYGKIPSVKDPVSISEKDGLVIAGRPVMTKVSPQVAVKQIEVAMLGLDPTTLLKTVVEETKGRFPFDSIQCLLYSTTRTPYDRAMVATVLSMAAELRVK